MKLHKLIFTILLLFASFQVFFGQENTKVQLFDEFGAINCDDLSHRIDKLMVNLNNDSSSVGYVVIYGSRNDPFYKYFQEHQLKTFIRFRNFDIKRIKFLHGGDEENLRTQLWKSSDNISKPDVKEIEWNYKLPPAMKPLKMHMDSWISEVCDEIFSLEYYSKFLRANPNIRGNIVIIGSNMDKFHKVENNLSRKLTGKYKVSRHQLKFFYVKNRNSDVEYWLVS